jgi:Ran GTPase-activating protein (RanGAP) involved in mRNA processing and transport
LRLKQVDLEKLLTVKNLTVLRLADNNLKQLASKFLDEYSSGNYIVKSLELLDLSGNNLGDPAAVSICRALYKSDKLRELSLRDTGFTLTAWQMILQVFKR